jgi:hypothetical protein
VEGFSFGDPVTCSKLQTPILGVFLGHDGILHGFLGRKFPGNRSAYVRNQDVQSILVRVGGRSSRPSVQSVVFPGPDGIRIESHVTVCADSSVAVGG